ncbi:Crp/Fnr family transcriptional regulator [Hyphomicrobium sp.]|uniref:Crp/Fnr family transcriptional regulator n=1 Tax=Hyphomicrobium sp. TaxID=82 RepID=UPI00132CC0BA|nr:Crp/Fnr family transcriptional regulator [Hyphomicrobium sp.]KAB2943661.1 MAG: Crp/Fnr family transcriptional regulator [Hyphomicrobium sp.]
MLTLLDPPSLKSRTSSADVVTDAGYRRLVAGEFLFREGDQRSHVYRVEKGSICLFKERLDGSRDVIEFAFPGDLVGLGYLDSHVSSAQATMETALSCLPHSALEPVLDKSPGSKSRLSAAIEREVAFLKEAQVHTGQSKALERIAALLVTLARCNAYEGRDPAIIADSLSCGVVAGYLNMSIDELAGALKELESRDLVEASTKGLRLKNLDMLEHLADAGGRNATGAL